MLLQSQQRLTRLLLRQQRLLARTPRDRSLWMCRFLQLLKLTQQRRRRLSKRSCCNPRSLRNSRKLFNRVNRKDLLLFSRRALIRQRPPLLPRMRVQAQRKQTALLLSSRSNRNNNRSSNKRNIIQRSRQLIARCMISMLSW